MSNNVDVLRALEGLSLDQLASIATNPGLVGPGVAAQIRATPPSSISTRAAAAGVIPSTMQGARPACRPGRVHHKQVGGQVRQAATFDHAQTVTRADQLISSQTDQGGRRPAWRATRRAGGRGLDGTGLSGRGPSGSVCSRRARAGVEGVIESNAGGLDLPRGDCQQCQRPRPPGLSSRARRQPPQVDPG